MNHPLLMNKVKTVTLLRHQERPRGHMHAEEMVSLSFPMVLLSEQADSFLNSPVPAALSGTSLPSVSLSQLTLYSEQQDRNRLHSPPLTWSFPQPKDQVCHNEFYFLLSHLPVAFLYFLLSAQGRHSPRPIWELNQQWPLSLCLYKQFFSGDGRSPRECRIFPRCSSLPLSPHCKSLSHLLSLITICSSQSRLLSSCWSRLFQIWATA